MSKYCKTIRSEYPYCAILVYIYHPKTAYSCKKSACPSKAELTATKSNDIIMRPCARCASCKINIS